MQEKDSKTSIEKKWQWITCENASQLLAKYPELLNVFLDFMGTIITMYVTLNFKIFNKKYIKINNSNIKKSLHIINLFISSHIYETEMIIGIEHGNRIEWNLQN